MSKERIVENLQLPKDVLLGIPIITLYGQNNLTIENHQGITYFDSDRISVRLPESLLTVHGGSLYIKEYAKEILIICGNIGRISFE